MRIHFNRYSETIPHDEAKANLLATCFADETSNLLTNASLCKQWYIVSNNKVRVVSLPTAYRHDNTYIYLAQDGDDLTHLELVSIPQAAPTSWFLAVLPEAVAHEAPFLARLVVVPRRLTAAAASVSAAAI